MATLQRHKAAGSTRPRASDLARGQPLPNCTKGNTGRPGEVSPHGPAPACRAAESAGQPARSPCFRASAHPAEAAAGQAVSGTRDLFTAFRTPLEADNTPYPHGLVGRVGF